jgi:hypothetical protein
MWKIKGQLLLGLAIAFRLGEGDLFDKLKIRTEERKIQQTRILHQGVSDVRADYRFAEIGKWMQLQHSFNEDGSLVPICGKLVSSAWDNRGALIQENLIFDHDFRAKWCAAGNWNQFPVSHSGHRHPLS